MREYKAMLGFPAEEELRWALEGHPGGEGGD